MVDGLGNLFIADTGSHHIRRVEAGTGTISTGIVDGTGPVQTIYGASPRDTFPAAVTNCLTGIAVSVDNSGAQVLQATDSCTGILVELTRELL